jgi:SSS family solute:Na+ symporter
VSATALSGFDLWVVAAYLAAIVGFGLWAGRGERSAADYFLAGRALPWWLIGLSFYASNMSGASFVGLVGASYEHGMAVFTYEWTATLVLVVFAFVMLPAFLRARIYTLPEYLERRFDRRCRELYGALTVIAVMFVDTAGALFAGGVVVSAVAPGIGLWQAAWGLAALAGLYTVFGGLRSVVVTDAIQAVLMIAGATVVCVAGLGAVGGWDGLADRLEPGFVRLFRPADDEFLPWTGIGGVVILGLYYWTLNQYFAQRALAARSLADGQKGALFGGLLKLPNLFLMVVPGMVALALFPALERPDDAFPRLVAELLPAGLRGLVLTALLAAIMSSLDSALNAVASVVTMDFLRPRRPDLDDRRLLRVGRLVTLACTVVAALWAPVIAGFGSLFAYFQSTLAYLVPPVVAVFLIGLLWRRANARGGFAGLACGLTLGLGLFAAKEATELWSAAGLPDIHFTLMALFIALAAAAVAIVASLTAPPPDAAHVAETTFRRADLAAATPRPRALLDSRLQAVALLVLMAAMIAVLW